jgi:4-hydroxybenzoate polyprenyltransferase
MNNFQKVLYICKTSFGIPVMFLFSSLWTLMMIKLVNKLDYHQLLSIKNVLAILLTFNLLWILRLIDEIKDFDYDQLVHPERGLPSGLVSFKDIKIFILFFSVLGFLVTFYFHSLISLFYPVTIIYGLCLIYFEKKSAFFKNNLLANLAMTYPVNTLINLTLLSFASSHFSDIKLNLIFILIPFFSFLHYEFGRKTMRKNQATKNLEYYSEQVGFLNSLLISISMPLLATLSSIWIIGFIPLHLFFILYPIIFGGLYGMNKIKPKIYKASTMGFLVSFYLFIILS